MAQVRQERPLSELFSELSREMSTLMRQEIRLAKIELSQKMQKAGSSLLMIVLGAVVLYTGFLALVFALIFGLSELIEPWMAALIVGLLILAVGGALAYLGYKELKSVDPVPRRTVHTLKEDTEWLKHQVG